MRALARPPALAAGRGPGSGRAEPASDSRSAIPPELTDPAMADKLGKMSGALTRALMDMPVGEIEAAVEGREPTPADRKRGPCATLAGRDPDLERKVEAQVAQACRACRRASRRWSPPARDHEGAREGRRARWRAASTGADRQHSQPGYPKR